MNIRNQTKNKFNWKAGVLCFLSALFLVNVANAQLASWNPAGLSGYGPSPWAPTFANSNVTIGGLTRGSGVGLSGTAAGSAWGGVNWAGSATQDALFTITPKSCYTISMSSLELRYRRSMTGPATGSLQYAVNGGAYSVITTYSFPSTSTAASGQDAGTVSLSGIPALQNVTAGTVIKFRILPTGGASAGTWYVFGTGASGGNAMVLNGTVSAVPNLNITTSAGAGGTISPSSPSVVCGTNQSFTITANPCFAIANVIVDGASQGAISNYTFTNVTEAHTISATFTQLTYSIAATPGANGSISPSGNSTVNCGSNLTYNISANSCYQIANVIVDGASLGPISSYTFPNVTAAHTISATFTQLTYSIAATAGANGSISPSGNSTVNCGSNLTYNISANSCYQIANVIVDGASQGPISSYTFPNVTAAHTISASFVLDASMQSTAPASAISDFNEICAGGSVNLTQQNGILAPGAAWTWYEGVCANGSPVGTGSSINITPTSGSHTYFVRAEGSCNTTACVSVSILVSAGAPNGIVAVPPINNLPIHACNGTTANNLNIPAVPGATQYIWDAPAGTVFNGSANPYISTTPNANIIFGNLSSSNSGYYLGVQASNACGTTLRKTQWVRSKLSTPAFSTAPTAVCPNISYVYTVAMVAGAVSYTFYPPVGATINGSASPFTTNLTSATVDFQSGFVSGQVCVTANTSCFSTVQKCVNVSKLAAQPGALSGVFVVCPGTSQTYSVPSLPGTYAWTLPANSNGSSTSNTITESFVTGFTAGNISVVYTNPCGNVSVARSKSITTGIPSTPTSITGSANNGLCATSATFNCPPMAGTSYIWTLPSGATGNSTSNSINVAFGTFTAGSICVKATNSCGISNQRCITVKGAPNTPTIIVTDPASWCAPTSGVEFSSDVNSVGGAYSLLWSWTPASAATYVSGQNNNNLILDWDNAGTATVSLTASNACGNATRVLPLNITTCLNNRQTQSANELEGNDQLSVYPNPTNRIINVDFIAGEKEAIIINIVDLAGRVKSSQTITTSLGLNHAQLNLESLAKGIYMLGIQTVTGNKMVKIVVQ